MEAIRQAIVTGVGGVTGEVTSLIGDITPVVVGVVGAVVLCTKGIAVFKTLVGKI